MLQDAVFCRTPDEVFFRESRRFSISDEKHVILGITCRVFCRLTRIMSRYGEFPRFIILVSIVSYLILTINNRDKAEQTLTVKQEGVIEGCCNFMQSPSVIRSSRSTQSFSSAQNIRQQGSSASLGMADDRAEALAGGLCRTASWVHEKP